MQNNGALPRSSKARNVLVVGEASQVYAQQAVAGGARVGQPSGSGGGSSDVVPVYSVKPVDGIRNAFTASGNTSAQVHLVLVDDANQTATIDGQSVPFTTVLAQARDADAVVVMAGTIAEEGADRATFADVTGKTLADVGHNLDGGTNPYIAFPFGHGLSYSTFESSKVLTTPEKTDGTKPIKVQAFVQNTSAIAGAEVVQVYAGVPAAGEPPKRLVAFAKVWLEPGEKKLVQLEIDPAASNHPLGTWDATADAWTTPKASSRSTSATPPRTPRPLSRPSPSATLPPRSYPASGAWVKRTVISWVSGSRPTTVTAPTVIAEMARASPSPA